MATTLQRVLLLEKKGYYSFANCSTINIIVGTKIESRDNIVCKMLQGPTTTVERIERNIGNRIIQYYAGRIKYNELQCTADMSKNNLDFLKKLMPTPEGYLYKKDLIIRFYDKNNLTKSFYILGAFISTLGFDNRFISFTVSIDSFMMDVL